MTTAQEHGMTEGMEQVTVEDVEFVRFYADEGVGLSVDHGLGFRDAENARKRINATLNRLALLASVKMDDCK